MSETDHQHRARLPAAVYDLALRRGVKPEDNRAGVKLTQTGRIKRKIDTGSWMSFTATQTISTHECAFDWRARAGPFGMVSARDALKNGEGQFDIMALGFIPLARAEHSSALLRGELMRYLAELAWAPDAILRNTELRWREDGPDKLAVSATGQLERIRVGPGLATAVGRHSFGTLMPMLRDAGGLETRFGTFVLGGGAFPFSLVD